MNTDDKTIEVKCQPCKAWFHVQVTHPEPWITGMIQKAHDVKCPRCGCLVTVLQWTGAMFPPRVVRL